MGESLLYPNLYKRYLPSIKKEYEVSFCKTDEIEDVIEFIDTHWKKNCAMVSSRELMDWQHFDKENNRYLYSIARHKKSGEIHALCGFITSKHYDNQIENMIAWGAIWKTLDIATMPILGILVESFAMQTLDPQTRAAVGMSNYSIKFAKNRGDIVGKANRFYILNDKIKSFKLCERNNSISFVESETSDDMFVSLDLEKYQNCNDVVFSKVLPYKSKKYYINRYYRHPIYQYYVTGIKDKNNGIKAIFFWRFCEHDDARCIRLVDYIGDGSELEGNLHNFQDLIYKTDSEFVDFFQYGFEKQHFQRGGWLDIVDTDAVLANYFEPFMLKNGELDFNFKSKDVSLAPMIFKGDADQDRPNVL